MWGFSRRALRFLCSYVPLNFYHVSRIPEVEVQPGCSLEIRRAEPADIPLISQCLDPSESDVVSEQIRHLFNGGGEAFLAFSDGKLVHVARLRYYPGVVNTKHPERDPRVKIRIDEAFIGHCQTLNGFCGRRIYPAILQHMARHVLLNGKNRCFICASPSNRASVKGIQTAGFTFVSKVRRLRLFGKIFNDVWCSPELDP